MKKRGTALLLALTLGICMAGCGAQSEETDDSSQTHRPGMTRILEIHRKKSRRAQEDREMFSWHIFPGQTMPFSKTMWMPCLRQV